MTWVKFYKNRTIFLILVGVIILLSFNQSLVSEPVFSWHIDPVVGDVIRLDFSRKQNFLNRWIIEQRFSIAPKTKGEFIWHDSGAVFIPNKLEGGKEYLLFFSSNLFSLIFPNLKVKTESSFMFRPPPLDSVQPDPRLLPIVKNNGFKRMDGKIVPFNNPITLDKYIDIDLHKKTVTLFDTDGKYLSTYDVLAYGKPYLWESKTGVILGPTPRGTFRVQYKAPRQFSNLSQVWMPWAMYFYGNYYLHGIPYFNDGRKYVSEYSGGCVRFTDEVAEKIYAFADLGTTVIIH